MSYEVHISVHFCYGHRLQHYDGPCRHLHGHNARAELTLAGAQLDANGMLCDFRHVKRRAREWIDAHLDHRMVLQAGDPLVAPLQAQGEPIVVLPDPPSAEHLARLICDGLRAAGLPVHRVQLWEGPEASAVYQATA